VKRFWADRLACIAPLLAHPRFVPTGIRSEFEKVVCTPVLDVNRIPDTPFGLFLDPDTGVPLPTASVHKAILAYAPIQFIATELNRLKPKYLICFDQSHDRNCGQPKPRQRQSKLTALGTLRIACMYYVSHAPFLFAAHDKTALESVRRRLVESGIPEWRFEHPEI
jgi:hypothetical protein